MYCPDQEALVEAEAGAAPHTVVVVRAPGAVLMPWLPRVDAVVNQLFGGQATNAVLAGVLSGRYNPAGTLTVSFPASLNDTWLSWPATFGPINPTSYPGTDRGRGFPEVDYNEGLFVGYRWFDGRNTTPLFPFGHGMSYSTFSYSQLALPSTPLTPASPNTTISCTLTLTGGATTGGEVAQLYVQGGLPGDPPKQLKGFQYTLFTPQAPSATVTFELSLTKDLVIWDTAAHAFLPYPPGSYSVFVGSSSRDIRLQGTIQVGA
jgi:beta-glucosidase